ncbi:hypothetical protein QEN19_004103 [Hanseniaspora menglaensis]
MLNLRIFHGLQRIRNHPKRYARLLLSSILTVSIFLILFESYKNNFISTIENQSNTEDINLGDYISKPDTKPGKQLLSFDEILGQPAEKLSDNKLLSNKQINKNVISLISSTKLTERSKDKLKECYIYFQGLSEDVFDNMKVLKNSFANDKEPLYQQMTYIARSYEHCKDLDYTNFTIDFENKDEYKYMGENTEKEMFKYKLVWNYILNTCFDSGIESKFYEFLSPTFIEKSINKWQLTSSEQEKTERIAITKKNQRLTDYENMQYSLKGENYLYEYNFDENLIKIKELSYMGKYLAFEIVEQDMFEQETTLNNDFVKYLQVDQLQPNTTMETQKETIGIILTMGSRHINILPKYLAALSYHFQDVNNNDNDYHLQIVFNDIEKEFNAGTDDIKTKEVIVNEILKPVFLPYLKNMKISILEVGKLLNVYPEVESSFKYFMNKWISLNFNQFNRFMFTDIDVTLFENPDQLFSATDNISELHNSGSDLANLFSKYKPVGSNKLIPMVLLPDRALKERTFGQCTQIFKNMLPTTKQRYDFNTFKCLSTPTLAQLHNLNPKLSAVFNNFFDIDIRKLHNIDSSLIIINNYNDVSSALMLSSLLNFIGLDKCVYGDKEFLLLGMVYLGRFDLSVMGLNTGMVTAENKIDSVFCGTQSAQVFNGKLISINGGLRKCKIDPVSYAIEKDLEFENKVDWLKDYYSIWDEELLKSEMEIDYMRKIDIEVVVESNPEYNFFLNKDYMQKDVENNYWLRSAFCMEYGYCLDMEEEEINERYLIKKLDTETAAKYKNIVDLWNIN